MDELKEEAIALWQKLHASGAMTHYGEGYILVKHQPVNHTCDLCRFLSIMDTLRKEKS